MLSAIALCLVGSGMAAGCSTTYRVAYLRHFSPQAAPDYYLVTIQAPTGDTQMSPHDWTFTETSRAYRLSLPGRPPAVGRLEFADVSLLESTGTADIPVELTGGFVEFDLPRNRLLLSLETPEGAFWANGSYPFHALDM